MLLIRQLIVKLLSQGIGDMGDEGMMVIILYAPRPRESGRKTRGGDSNGQDHNYVDTQLRYSINT